MLDHNDNVQFISDWYERQCDGDWEHGVGIRLTTLDNPGWMITIRLDETTLDGCILEMVTDETSDDDWIHYWADGQIFRAACSPRNLNRALSEFSRFAAANERKAE